MKQTSRLYKWIVTTMLTMAGLVMSSHASTTVVNDTWTDGTRTDPASPVFSENGVDSDADGSIESAWFKGGSGTMSAAPGHLQVNGLTTSSSFWTTYFTPAASPVTLASVGDQIHLTWVFTPSGVNSGNTSQGFPVALVRSPANLARLSTDTTPPVTNYPGYSLFMNMGPILSNANSFQLREWTNSTFSGALLGTSGNWSPLTNTVGVGANGYTSGTTYTLDIFITRNASAGVDIVASMSGGTLNGVGSNYLAFTDTTPNSFEYDTFSVRPATTAQVATDFDTTLFRVVFTPGCDTARIAASPTNTTSFVSQSATFNVTATGSSPTYQWQVSTDNGSTFGNISGATSASYTTNGLTLAANGNQFRCAVSVACDSSTTNSAAATLTVNSCTTAGVAGGGDPTNTTVGAGSSASFFVTGTGSAPTYQWQVSTNSGVNWDNVPGATASTYTTPPTFATNNGYQYRSLVNVACDSSSVTSAVATLTVVCSTAGIGTPPANTAAFAGNSATFSVVATGSLPTYQWETNNGGGWLSVPGATSSNFTIAVTAPGDNGLQARCDVNVACDSSSVTSSAATLEVGTAGSTSYRSASSGTWSSAAIWQWSFDGGASWFTAGTAPSDANSTNILVQAAHIVTVNSAVSADDLTINGQVTISGAAFTIATDGAAVNGKLVVSSTANSSLVRTGPLTFNNGGEFDWTLATTAPTIPMATWADGSTCRITSGPGSNYSVTNVDGQNFYNFVWDFAAQNSTADLGIITATTVRGDLSITNGKTISLNNTGPTAGTLNVNGNFTVAGSGKVSLVGPVTNNWEQNVNIGGNLLVVSTGAGLDSVSTNTQTHVTFNGSGAQTVNITSSVSGAGRTTWKVNNGSSLKLLGLATSGQASLTVNGTLDLNGVVFSSQILNGASTGLVTNSGPAVTLTIGANATNSGTYSGVFRDGGNAISLTKGNTNSLTLDGTAANQYSGATTVSGGGQLTVAKDGGLGSNVVVSGTSTLVLTNGTSNNYITDTANLNLSASSSVVLGFTGADDTIGTLTISGAIQPAGSWGAPGTGASHTNAQFSGTGRLNVASGVPELISSPADVVTNLGDTVVFTSSIVGTPTPTRQWQVSTNSGTSWDNVPGETASSLTFTAQLAQSGNQYRLTATNSVGSVNSAAATLTVSCPVITLGMLPNAAKGGKYNQALSASGGLAPYTYVLTNGMLPPGLVLTVTNTIVGKATTYGSYSFTVIATDANGCTGGSNYTMLVSSTGLDTTGPKVTITTPKNGAVVTNPPVTLTGKATDAVQTTNVTYTLDGGPVTEALFTVTNAAPWSISLSNLTAGAHTVTVQGTDLSGNLGAAVAVTFNYGTNSFLPLAGVYFGLFSESSSNVAYPSAGFAKVTITAKPSKLPTFSASFNVAGTKVSGSGTFGMDGTGLLKKPMTQNGQNVTLSLTLPFDGSGTLTGTISNAAATPPWSSTLLADLAVTNKVATAGTNYDGTYTLVVPSPTNTIGDGYGFLIITNGQIKLGGGKLANAQAFSQSGAYLSEHGDWPLFVKGDTSGGINKSELLGWASVSTNHAITTANLVWINTGGLVTYPGGFTNNVGLAASLYDANFGSGLVLSLDSNTPVANGNVTLSGNGLTTNIVNSVSLQNVGGKNKFLDTLGTKTNKQYSLVVTLSAPKGTIGGSFKAPDDGVAKGNIFGVVLQSSNTANGYFLQNPVTPQSGTFRLK